MKGTLHYKLACHVVHDHVQVFGILERIMKLKVDGNNKNTHTQLVNTRTRAFDSRIYNNI